MSGRELEPEGPVGSLPTHPCPMLRPTGRGAPGARAWDDWLQPPGAVLLPCSLWPCWARSNPLTSSWRLTFNVRSQGRESDMPRAEIGAFSGSFCRGLLRVRVGSVSPPHPVLASSAHGHRESSTFVWFCSVRADTFLNAAGTSFIHTGDL